MWEKNHCRGKTSEEGDETMRGHSLTGEENEPFLANTLCNDLCTRTVFKKNIKVLWHVHCWTLIIGCQVVCSWSLMDSIDSRKLKHCSPGNVTEV